MEYKHDYQYTDYLLLGLLAILPNILGIVNIKTGFVTIHLFVAGIFLAALFYGRTGGLVAGIGGSLYSAFAMHNPYIVVGNAILGFFTGYFLSRKMKLVSAAMLAFLIQLPWLLVSDIAFMGMPVPVVLTIAASLAVSDMVFAYLVQVIHARVS